MLPWLRSTSITMTMSMTDATSVQVHRLLVGCICSDAVLMMLTYIHTLMGVAVTLTLTTR